MTMRWVVLLCAVGCGDGFSGVGTPEQVVSGAKDGDRVTVTGEVHTVTYETTQSAQRRAAVASAGDLSDLRALERLMEQTDEKRRGMKHAFDDGAAGYPRTTDRYILLRTAKPDGITLGETNFVPSKLVPAWGIGVHLRDLEPGAAMPEIGSTIKVTGTFRRIIWNQREVDVPIVDDPTIEIISGPRDLVAAGGACALDQECNARLICDRASRTCALPPREIYWADPWHDVNGACTVDADCPLGQVCDPGYAITATGPFAAHYFIAEDVGRHVCRLAPGATVASQCPRIYTARDIAGGRFVAGKEVCVRTTLFVAVAAEDGDTHAQMRVDEPIPYPTADASPTVFGATTENGPMYKDPALSGGPIADPVDGQEVITIGTFRYDPDHGWYEVHPVKAYLPVR